MSDMHMREKLRKVTQAAKHGADVPEQTKKWGLILFLSFFIIGILVLFALMIGFILNENPIAAAVTAFIAIFLAYCVYKIITTDDVQHL
ncbi:hypothetical protein ACXYMX_03325 [Sporosarcina sp. CAU 1771]